MLSTESYKGVRDFPPQEMAKQRYIFDTWARVAESFGYERFDASVLEPSELYSAKGAENAELVNEQTYSFIDRGERSVTLRPEMTPTAARMIAARRRELSFPVRWYAIPNLFRYERPQRGRLREHWQLNCDIFGDTSVWSDVEILLLARAVLTGFGANDNMFTIRINDRGFMNEHFATLGLSDTQKRDMFALLDRRNKISGSAFAEEAEKIMGVAYVEPVVHAESRLGQIIAELKKMGVDNVLIDTSIVRGFNYYTGMVFEVYDTDEANTRALLGGGRYDNLTALFGGEPISGIGFGMGDVSMYNFCETHDLLPADLSAAPTLAIIPLDESVTPACLTLAEQFRGYGVTTRIEFGDRKLPKKIERADKDGIRSVIVVGPEELARGTYTLKHLAEHTTTEGSLETLAAALTTQH